MELRSLQDIIEVARAMRGGWLLAIERGFRQRATANPQREVAPAPGRSIPAERVHVAQPAPGGDPSMPCVGAGPEKTVSSRAVRVAVTQARPLPLQPHQRC
jgi:hypothetical protein